MVAHGSDGSVLVSVDVDAGHEGSHGVERAMPWLTSFCFHAGVGLVGAFVFYVSLVPAKVQEPVVVISSIPFSDEEMKGLRKEGLGDNPQLPTMQPFVKTTSDGVDPRGTATGLLSESAGADKKPLDLGYITGGTGASLLKGALEGGMGTGKVGRLAPFGTPGGGGDHVVIPSANGVKSVVYLLDHSGSMLDTFDYLRAEVKRGTGELKPVQKFSVIMFSEEVTVLGPNELQWARKEALEDMRARLDTVRAQGQNNDLLEPFKKGFEKAFAMKPEAIVFLTDGAFDPRLVEVVANLNKEHKVKIATIAYVSVSAESAKNLEKIAADNGGAYRFVSEQDVTGK